MPVIIALSLNKSSLIEIEWLAILLFVILFSANAILVEVPNELLTVISVTYLILIVDKGLIVPML